MANLTINSLFLVTVFLIALGLLLLSHPLLTLTAITLCAICHALFYNNIPSVVRLHSFILSNIWADNNDHPATNACNLFDGAEMPSPIPHISAGQDIVKSRKIVSDEIISSTPQSSPKSHAIDNSLLQRSHTPSPGEGRQLSFSRITPKPTRLLTQEEFKGNVDNSFKSKMRNRAVGGKTVQTVAGPLLASTRLNNHFDTGMYVNVNSPGFTERLIRCANDNSALSWSQGNLDTHQEKYNSVGLFPIVHLSSAPPPTISIRNSLKAPRSSVRVRIAPPVLNEQRLYNGLSGNSVSSGTSNIQEPARQDNMAKSVLESLQEASRKRIYSQCQEAMEDDAGKKRPRKGDSGFPNPNCDLYQYRHIFRAPALPPNVGCGQSYDSLNQGKRGREDVSPGSSDCKRYRQSNKQGSSRNEISSSLSSSQKLLQRLSGNKRKAEGDWSRPGTPSHGKHFKDDLEPCKGHAWSFTNQDETTTHTNDITQPGHVEGEGNCNSESNHTNDDTKMKTNISAKPTKSKRTVSSKSETATENLESSEAPSTCDISSKLFRKEVLCRPISQRSENKRGRSWAQEPPDADERCITQQSESSELDRPERFQSLLSRMCKQGSHGGKQKGEIHHHSVIAAVDPHVSTGQSSTDLLSQHLCSGLGNKPSGPSLMFSSPPLPFSSQVDGSSVSKVVPTVPLESQGIANISPSNSLKHSLASTMSSSVATTSVFTSMGSAVCFSEHNKTSGISNAQQCAGPPSYQLSMKPTHDTSNTEKNNHKKAGISLLSEGVTSVGDNHLSVKSSSSSSLNPGSLSGVVTPISSGIFEKTNETPLITSGPATSQPVFKVASASFHYIGNTTSAPVDPKTDSGEILSSVNNQNSHLKASGTPLSSVIATTSDSAARQLQTIPNQNLRGFSNMNTENSASKSQSSSGVSNAVSQGLQTGPGFGEVPSVSEGSAIFAVTTPLVSASTTAYSISPPNKTILKEEDKITLQSSVLGGKSCLPISSSVPTTQSVFSVFGSTADLPSTSHPVFSPSGVQNQSSGLFCFGSSSSQTQTNFLNSTQCSGLNFGGSQPQAFPPFSSASENLPFGNTTVSTGAFSPLSNVSFGTAQSSPPNLYSTHSGPVLETFGASSPFVSTSVQSNSSNFNASSPPSSSITSPTPAVFGSAASSNIGSNLQFGSINDKSSEETFNFNRSNSSFTFGSSSSQVQHVNQPFQFGQNLNSAPASTFQFGAAGPQPPGSGAPVFSIGAGPSSTHRSRLAREARRRR